MGFWIKQASYLLCVCHLQRERVSRQKAYSQSRIRHEPNLCMLIPISLGKLAHVFQYISQGDDLMPIHLLLLCSSGGGISWSSHVGRVIAPVVA